MLVLSRRVDEEITISHVDGSFIATLSASALSQNQAKMEADVSPDYYLGNDDTDQYLSEWMQPRGVIVINSEVTGEASATIHVLSIQGNQVKIGIDADKHEIVILRSEIVTDEQKQGFDREFLLSA